MKEKNIEFQVCVILEIPNKATEQMLLFIFGFLLQHILSNLSSCPNQINIRPILMLSKIRKPE